MHSYPSSPSSDGLVNEPTMSTAPEEEPAFDTPDGFALRVKYQKHIFCIPVESKSTYDNLIQVSLKLLERSNLSPPSNLKASSFSEVDSKEVALFEGAQSTSGSGSESSQLRFIEIPRKKATISAMGLKDGADAVVYLGFKDAGSEVFTQPDVSIPPIFDEEDEASAE